MEDHKMIFDQFHFPLIRSSRLKGHKIEHNKERGTGKKSKKDHQSAECGGNQDVRYQERSEMTLDYTKLFRWQETSSQGSFHVGMGRQPMRYGLRQSNSILWACSIGRWYPLGVWNSTNLANVCQA